MKEDPIIQELRTVRRKIEKGCGATADGYAEHIRSIEKQHTSRLVLFGPKSASGSNRHIAEQGEMYRHVGEPNKSCD